MEKYLETLRDSSIANDTAFPVWIWKTEPVTVKNRRYLKIWLFNRYMNGEEINRIDFIHNGEEHTVSSFSPVTDYPAENFFGAVLELDLEDTSSDLSVAKEIIAGNVYEASGETVTYDFSEIPAQDFSYLQRKMNLSVYPQIRGAWWQCSCGRINNNGDTCLCGRTEELMQGILDFDFEENRIKDYLVNPVSYDLSLSFDENISRYLSVFHELYPSIEAGRVEDRLDLKAEQEKYDRLIEQKEKDEQERQLAQQRKKEKKKKTVRIVKRTVFAAVLIALVSFVSVKYIIPEVKRSNAYKSAQQLLEAEEYDQAYQQFTELGEYKDCTEMAFVSVYRKAEKQNSEEKYEDAIRTWQRIENYSDSKDRITQAEEAWNEQRYQSALAYVKEKKFYKAINVFNEISSYKDSKEQIKKTHYLYGKDYMASGELTNAVREFIKVKDYEDTKEQLYQCALKLADKKYYSSAIDAFTAIKGYSDADQRLLDTKWAYANSMTGGEQAKKLYKELAAAGYPGAQAKYNELIAWHVSLYAHDGSYTSKSSLSKYGEIWFQYSVSGGDGGSIHLIYRYTLPDGTKRDVDLGNLKAGDSGGRGWGNGIWDTPSSAPSGYVTVSIVGTNGKVYATCKVYYG